MEKHMKVLGTFTKSIEERNSCCFSASPGQFQIRASPREYKLQYLKFDDWN